jgi:hypothetical protein
MDRNYKSAAEYERFLQELENMPLIPKGTKCHLCPVVFGITSLSWVPYNNDMVPMCFSCAH